MSNISIKGHVTVQIEDQHGTIRRRVEADNMLAPVALSCLLFTGLNSFTTTFKTALGFGGTIAQSQQVSLAGTVLQPACGIVFPRCPCPGRVYRFIRTTYRFGAVSATESETST
jgi:hypothetical protein